MSRYLRCQHALSPLAGARGLRGYCGIGARELGATFRRDLMGTIFRVSFKAATSKVLIIAACLGLAPTIAAAECGRDGSGFASWLQQFKAKAATQGISASTLSSALDGVSYDRKVISLDRGQRSFKLSFDQFYARRVSGGLI